MEHLNDERSTLNLAEASIKDLLHAMSVGAISSVELVSLYLHRIGRYDCCGPALNSVCVINPDVFSEAQASDDYRASGASPRPLEGIPFTVKDSFKVKGMAVAAGSPAFADLEANEDAAIVSLLRQAGAIILGRTNMPPMADGGPQRGLFGRAESPYNPKYLTTAFASGSSNGCGTATTCSFASFGFAGETVSSGRSPASNNALIGYSPSRGVIPNRGQWPLYPTCDVIVPHTRSVDDLLAVLNVIVADDADACRGIDYWRNQKYLPIPKSSDVRPADYCSLASLDSLRGKRVAVPRCYIGEPGAVPVHVCTDSVRRLWDNVVLVFEQLGATVVETDFPVLEQYTNQDFPGQNCNVPGMPEAWPDVERCDMIATAWDDFLRQNGDPKYPDFQAADTDKIHPLVAPMDDPSQHSEAKNQVRYTDMKKAVKGRENTLYDFPGSKEAIESLELMRKNFYDDWMVEKGYDLVAFPTNGDVPYADADETLESMNHAIQDGIKYANGGRALKHLGIPCITLPMGEMMDKKMPVGITFCTRAYDDSNLLRYASSFEAKSRLRTSPRLTPPIETDFISLNRCAAPSSMASKPTLVVSSAQWSKREDITNWYWHISLSGIVESAYGSAVQSVNVFINGEISSNIPMGEGGQWKWGARVCRAKQEERYPIPAPVPKKSILVLVIVTQNNGRSAAHLLQVD